MSLLLHQPDTFRYVVMPAQSDACKDELCFEGSQCKNACWLCLGLRTMGAGQGLEVALHPYQKQTLRFLIDSERGEGGWRRHLWIQLRTGSGEPFWYSPVLRRAAWIVPAAPWGGFLAEEMARPLRAFELG